MTTTSRCIVLLACALVAHAEARLEFVDIRAQAGLVETQNLGGAVTLMAGNLGEKNRGGEELPDDLGLVIGLRGSAGRLKAFDGDDSIDCNIASAGALAGFGYYVNKREHVELCAGYALGRVTLLEDYGGFRDCSGHSNTISGEFGWYRTWRSHWQLGILAGWSLTRFKADTGSGVEVSARSSGVNVATSLGWRF